MITLRHYIEYALLLTIKGVVRLTPIRSQTHLANTLNWIFKRFDRRHYQQVADNLALAFPDKSADERDALREEIYRHFSSIVTEWIYLFTRHRRPPGALPITIVNSKHLQTVLNSENGAILVSAHFGNWELIPYILKDLLPSPLIAIARPMNNPLIEQVVSQFRDFMGSQIIYKHGALRKIINHLKNKRLIYLLIDQNAVPREAVFVDFFSQKISAIASAAQIHLKKGAPLLPLFLHYERDRIILEFLQPIFATHDNKTVESLTQDLTKTIEEQIRKNPEQWLWFHNRWKTRPSGALT